MPLRVSGDYALKVLAGYAGYEDELRTILGVTDDELSNTEINSLIIIPAADNKVAKLVPTFATDYPDSIELILAVLYFAADNIVTSFKSKLAQHETDNKSAYKRFEDAFEEDFNAKAWEQLEELIPGITGGTPNLFTLVKPRTDPVTGDEIV